MTDATPAGTLFATPLLPTHGQPVTEELPADITIDSLPFIVTESNWRTEDGTTVSLVRHVYYTSLPSQPGEMQQFTRFELKVGGEPLDIQKLHTRYVSHSTRLHTVTLITTKGRLLMVHDTTSPIGEFVYSTYWCDSKLTFVDRGNQFDDYMGHYPPASKPRFDPILFDPAWSLHDKIVEIDGDYPALSAIKATAKLPVHTYNLPIQKVDYLAYLDALAPDRINDQPAPDA